MTSVLIIDKTASVKSLNIAKFSQDDLYKKAGFKTSTGFAKITNWSINIQNVLYSIEVYGKTSGRAGQENKYEFPPPIDNTLLFGSCVILCRRQSDQSVVSITTEQWNALYESLYGGFDDLTQSSGESSSEEDSIENRNKTKTGYAKDGFVVDDSEEITEDSDSDPPTPKRKKPVSKVPTRMATNRKKTTAQSQPAETVVATEEPVINDSEMEHAYEPEHEHDEAHETNDVPEENYLGCTKELCEEEYLPYE